MTPGELAGAAIAVLDERGWSNGYPRDGQVCIATAIGAAVRGAGIEQWWNCTEYRLSLIHISEPTRP